jgi:hypothetical protein
MSAKLAPLDVTRPEVNAIIKLYLQRNVYYEATVSAYGYRYHPKDMRVFKTWMDEQSFLTPRACQIASGRLPRKPLEPFKRIYEMKLEEVKGTRARSDPRGRTPSRPMLPSRTDRTLHCAFDGGRRSESRLAPRELRAWGVTFSSVRQFAPAVARARPR